MNLFISTTGLNSAKVSLEPKEIVAANQRSFGWNSYADGPKGCHSEPDIQALLLCVFGVGVVQQLEILPYLLDKEENISRDSHLPCFLLDHITNHDGQGQLFDYLCREDNIKGLLRLDFDHQ